MKRREFKIIVITFATTLLVSVGISVLAVKTAHCSEDRRIDRLSEYYTYDVIDFNFDWWRANEDSIKEADSFPVNIPYADDVFNIDNTEYVLEVCFNHDIHPNTLSSTALQYLFVHRYYDSCEESTQNWYHWYREWSQGDPFKPCKTVVN